MARLWDEIRRTVAVWLFGLALSAHPEETYTTSVDLVVTTGQRSRGGA
jgi:hypothetical protein